ncbi:MAG: NAD-dependent epimerase/dehydratase family protein [Candidatus Helarchaeota archaeon]
MSKNIRNVLVTGGGGYIGSVLTRKLINKDYSVIVFDNFSFSDIGIKNLKKNQSIDVIKGDIRSQKDVNKVFENINIDAVIHLAAISDGMSGRRDPSLTKEINIDAFYQFAKKSKAEGVDRFIFASTFGVYGNQYKFPITENLKVNPVDPYSISKSEGEKILKELNSSQFTTTSLRIAMVYGVSPRMRFDFIVNYMTNHRFI